MGLPQTPTDDPRSVFEQIDDATIRNERMKAAEDSIRFRSVRDRTAADQAEAIARGYDSVEQLAIDELGQAYHELRERIEVGQGYHELVRRIEALEAAASV